MRPVHRVGMLLWRGGLMLAGSYSLYRVSRIALRYFDLPTPVEVGAGLIAAGCLLFLVSLIAERIHDARHEDLSEL